MPLEEGGWHTLLRHGVYMSGDFCWGGGGVLRLDLVGAGDGNVVTTEGVGLGPGKVFAIDGQQRHKAWEDGGIGHCEGWCRTIKDQSYSLPLTWSALHRESE